MTRSDQLQTPELECQELSVTFGGVHAVENVSLGVHRGEILGLIGPNGAGKTTLVNALTGVVAVSHGSVLVHGEDVTGSAPDTLPARGVGRTFQAARMFGGLTASENIEVAALQHGMGRRDARKKARELLAWVGLEARRDVRADSLAYGEERLLSIARVLAIEPTTILLDEPAAGMAESETDDLSTLIVSIKDRLDCAVLVIEHDMRLVMSVCDRLHVLENGRTLRTGTPAEIRHDPVVVAAYFGGGSTTS